MKSGVKMMIYILPLLAVNSAVALTDRRLPNIFYPFGTDVGDRVSPPGDETTDGPYGANFMFYGRIRQSIYVRFLFMHVVYYIPSTGLGCRPETCD